MAANDDSRYIQPRALSKPEDIWDGEVVREMFASLRALEAQWRESAQAEHDDMGNTQYASALDQCADDLNAWIDAHSNKTEVPDGH